MKQYACMKSAPYFLFLLILMFFKCGAGGISLFGTHNTTILCISKEREALIQFKKDIGSDSCGLLTWRDDLDDSQSDCCSWPGISCDKGTGHVISLKIINDGYNCKLGGKISPSLLELKYLTYLEISNNGLNQTIPSFIGSFRNLQYLNLANNFFHGEIPNQLANLSRLISLDLRSDQYGLSVKSLGWLSRLTSLAYVNLSKVNLNQALDWLQIVNGLPFLRGLFLDDCSLPSTIPPFLSYENSSTTLYVLSIRENTLNDSPILQWVTNLTRISTGLEYLDLSFNGIRGPIPDTFGRNMHSLLYLDLSCNQLEGQIPSSLSQLKHLEALYLDDNKLQGIQLSNSLGSLCSLKRLWLYDNNITNDFSSIIQLFSECANNSLVLLDLTNNSFWGSIPNAIGTFSSLESLRLSYNKLNGTISRNFGQLSKLTELDLSANSWNCTLSDHHFSNISSLESLELYDNAELVVNFSADWVPPFQLGLIFLRSCKLGPGFPNWLLTQKNYNILDISNTGIIDTIPDSFWTSLPSMLWQLNLSHNEIFGVLPNLPITFQIVLDLSSSHIKGPIPSFLGDAIVLLINNNELSGSIAPLCLRTKRNLQILDLSNNFLSGQLLDCWEDAEALNILRLDNNNFTGELPPSFGFLNGLVFLSLHNNHFSGELHMLFKNLTSLAILDVGYNSFSGYISEGIGSTLKSIQILDLRSNNLSGRLPSSLCQLTSLQILDLSFNHISGTIPECICNLQAMANSAYNMSLTRGGGVFRADTIYYVVTQMIAWKRKEQSFSSNLGLVRSFAISDNELEGQIPAGFSCLTSLTSLDLARNNLTGSIPPKLGELASLEYLDLSRNHLSGVIPSSLANLHFLGTLDLSYNNLSGKIPTNTQLQRSDPLAYVGNPSLCGPPLPECIRDLASSNVPLVTQEEANDGSYIFPGLYISVVLGFIVGFWGVCGTLVIRRSWRHTYFRFVEDMYDRFHLMVVATTGRVWRRP